MLDLKLVGAHNAEGPRRSGPVVLLPEHWRRLIEALTLRARRRRDLPRPNPVEVGDERRDLLRRRSDRAFVPVTDLHYSDSDHWDRRTTAVPGPPVRPAKGPGVGQGRRPPDRDPSVEPHGQPGIGASPAHPQGPHAI